MNIPIIYYDETWEHSDDGYKHNQFNEDIPRKTKVVYKTHHCK